MIDPNVIKTIGELGVPAALLIAFLAFGGYLIPKMLAWNATETTRRDQAIAKMQEQMVSVVANNTEAITRLCDSSGQTDQRAQRIEAVVNQVASATDRIERKIDTLHGGQVDAVRPVRRAGL